MKKLYIWWIKRKIEALQVDQAGHEAEVAANNKAGYVCCYSLKQVARCKARIEQLKSKIT